MKDNKKKVFQRIKEGKKIAGVCTGLADYIGVDVTLLRFSFIIGFLSPYPFGFAYLILWLLSSYRSGEDLSSHNEYAPKNKVK